MGKQVSIRIKIIGGFLVVALSLAVGTGVGLWSLSVGVRAQEEAALVRLPAVNALWKVKEAQTEIMKSERSLLIPGRSRGMKSRCRKNGSRMRGGMPPTA